MRISDWSSDVCSSDLQAEIQRASALNPGGGVRHASGKSGNVSDLAAGSSARISKQRKRTARCRANSAVARRRATASPHRILVTRAGSAVASDQSEEHTSELQSLIRTPYAVSLFQ